MFGITNPFAFELPEYLGYNISQLKGHARFLEVVLNRDGESNDMVPLFFDGATNFFSELPSYKDTNAMNKVISYIQRLKSPANKVFFTYTNSYAKSVIAAKTFFIHTFNKLFKH